ncbi:MAG: hypothetical protein NTV07_00680 [Candidatus Omnitrophica bacterium]|nr:hypothetical protein [Candidatus Omnitrophota bacterium]
MKKLIMLAMAVAMVAVFLPSTYAADTANLQLDVTFRINHPPVWVIEPQDGQVVAGQQIVVKLSAEDPESGQLSYECRWWLNGVRQNRGLPNGAVFTWKSAMPGFVPNLTWDVPSDINLNDIHEFEFQAYDGNPGTGGNMISKKIRITIQPLPVISIELNISQLALVGAELGKTYPAGDVEITNTGNITVNIDIGYGPPNDYVIQPGLEQGPDRFITMFGDSVLPPNDRLAYAQPINPGEQAPLQFTYGAPTQLSQPVTQMNANYEIRAYSAVNQ